VALPDGDLAASFPRLDELFRAKYAEVFSETFLEEPLEIVNWKVEAVGPEATLTEGYGIAGTDARAGDVEGARKGTRSAYFEDGYVDCAVYDRYRLPIGAEIEGPAMVEERESTCIIGPEDRAVVDRHLNLVAELGE